MKCLLIAMPLVMVWGCDSGRDEGVGPPASDTAGTTTAAAPIAEATAAAASSAGCTQRRSQEPEGEINSRAVGDLDGDGAGDEVLAWGRQSERVFTVRTAAGGLSEWSETNPSGADPHIYGIADANGDGKLELFVSPGRTAYVLTLSDCKIQPYLNREGKPYGFDRTGQQGTGVGCVDVDGDGRLELVGLLKLETGGVEVRWRRTVVQLEGQQARNGRVDEGSYRSPDDDAAIELLSEVTCGDEDWS